MLATRSLVASTILAAAAALTVVPVGSAVADDPKPPPSQSSVPAQPKIDRDAAAVEAAEFVIAAQAPQLHLSRYDKVHQARPTMRSDHLRFVSYERTYRGLPVVGGDFVVVVDGRNVVHTSVAQTGKVSLPDVKASVTAASARAKSAAKVNHARLGGSRLVVLQRGSRSDLAWQTTALGRRAGKPSKLDVYVDADSGQVLETFENVQSGDGNAALSGPSPVPIVTRRVGTTYQLTMGSAPTLTCQDAANNTTFTGPDDVWGNGDPVNKETGCVDAFYAAQQMKTMMSVWLGRSGMNGMGGWLPIRVGLNDTNAYYDGSQVQIGHNPSGQWVGSLDVTAHEFGHGVDDHTPGGISRNGTQEFVADTFGTAAEWWDNQPAPHDVRDFLIGEEVNLGGSGEIRNMANPAAEGHPACYSASIGTNPNNVHADAGPGDHWFYLASQGSQPASGPVSPVCSGPRVFGIGIAKVMKILYTAMLMKTSASSYPNYRLWTLAAARNLYGTSVCTEFNRVKAAWNAVSVPAQPGESVCQAGFPYPRITNASSRTFTAGTTITPFTLNATQGTPPYTWSASGLPPGLSINSGTGQVSGTLATHTTGVHTVLVLATDDIGRVGRAWFTITVKPTASTTCSGQRLGNAGFEADTDAPWTAFSWLIAPHGSSVSRTGTSHAWLGGYGSTTNHLGTRTDTMTQQVRVPAGCTATLSFYVWSLTDEAPGTTVYDSLTVKAGATVLFTQSNVNAIDVDSCGSCPKSYVLRTVVLPSTLSGKTFDLSFTTTEDGSLFTNWHIDDVALNLSP